LLVPAAEQIGGRLSARRVVAIVNHETNAT
jgi:hypothetical protein